MKKRFGTIYLGVISFGIGFFFGGKTLVNLINNYKMRMSRNLSNMMVFNNWLDFIYSGGNIEQYFYRHKYRRIMIYGNGYIGIRLCQALEEKEIEVVAIMDKAIVEGNEMVIGINSDIPDVDCVVVTPVFYYDEISAELRKKTNRPIISIEEIWLEHL